MILLILCALCPALSAQEAVVEPSPPQKGGRGLGTAAYGETAKEKPFSEKVTEKPVTFESDVKLPKPANMTDEEWAKLQKEMKQAEEERKTKTIPDSKYTLPDQAGQYVGWFGIVRKKTTDEKTGGLTLMVEHKYFDEMTDLHQQIVSIYGAGDFSAALGKSKAEIPPLSLVRVYGKVKKDKAGAASVAADYVRVWDWGTFAFMDYGKDKSNPAWVKLRKVAGSDAYAARPTKEYYESLLGARP
jgi:hypothetical protein